MSPQSQVELPFPHFSLHTQVQVTSRHSLKTPCNSKDFPHAKPASECKLVRCLCDSVHTAVTSGSQVYSRFVALCYVVSRFVVYPCDTSSIVHCPRRSLASSTYKVRRWLGPLPHQPPPPSTPYHLSFDMSSTATVPSSDETFRDYLLEEIRAKYPNFTPRHDFDILVLSDQEYEGPPGGIYAWLDGELAEAVNDGGDVDEIVENARHLLSASMALHSTGVRGYEL